MEPNNFKSLFVFNNNLNNLIQRGRSTKTSVICYSEIIVPNNNYIVLGTISSNDNF